jgi:hypothetical protein
MLLSMPHITAKYWDFYVEGREARTLKLDRIYPEDIANKLRAGETTLRDAILAACESIALLSVSSGSKRTWISRHEAAIAEAGGDAEAAHMAWIRGRIDELAYVVEPEVISALSDEEEELLSDSDDDEDGEDGEEEY